METAVGSFAIPGATLAQIMHDFGSVEGDCDGLLFGRLQHRTTSSIQDDEAGPSILHERVTARVTGYYCSGRVQSFYDATGRLNHSKLASIIRDRQVRGEDPPIGWYLGRRNATVRPSMREAAVTSYLRSGVITTTRVEEDDTSNLISPELKSLQIGSSAQGVEPTSSVSSSVTRRKHSVQTVENKAARAIVAKPPLLSVPGSLDSPVSPSKSVSPSGSTSSPHREKRIEPVAPPVTTPLANASLAPCFFVLFTESDSTSNAVRTHEYRAFQSLQSRRGLSFEPLPVNIVNAGLSFRGFYDSFVPVASIKPWLSYDLSSEASAYERSTSPTNLKLGRTSPAKSISLENNGGRSSSRTYQDASDASLESLSGDESLDFIQVRGLGVSQFEAMYQQMLTKLQRLSVETHESSLALRKYS